MPREISVIVKEEPALVGPAKFGVGISEGCSPDHAVFLLFTAAVRLVVGGLPRGEPSGGGEKDKKPEGGE